jgi:glyceraldehyde 3-phosphate dehydrogenase
MCRGGDLGCEIVLECTGRFLKPDQLQGYFKRGVKKVIVAAPVKDGPALNVVVGINDDRYDRREHRLLTAASCTTNCLAPVVKVVHEALGIRHGQITTIHNPTNTNVVVDAPHRDLRRARSAMLSLQPTTTGSATAIALIYPELKGRLNGHAVRVPVLNASLIDCVFELQRPATAEEVNALFHAAAEGPLAGILGFEARPLVSADYGNDTRSAIVDGPSTMVTDGTLLKIYAWYDNEVGYACRMVDLANIVIARSLMGGIRNYLIVTVSYWSFTLTDGALRMLVLLHFYALGYTPFMLASLFLLYETAGIFANLGGGWLATRFGIPRMLAAGLVLQSQG